MRALPSLKPTHKGRGEPQSCRSRGLARGQRPPAQSPWLKVAPAPGTKKSS
ncbi:hypothetical protein MBAV_004365 [Candidatus Magnetobacterium bavaricum]|uniref:Uncharacterized protein n=1 Tax=Candidatus Magnetobacterium bavaricum TaxID=29290 RepID=A0A0F3GN89_9BACT|nr:hypothetical protein MBAV_004365 [Candidatus Magnetobacterium bavaricum]